MNKTKGINRLFLFLIVWQLTGYLGIAFLMRGMSTVAGTLISQALLFLPVVLYLLIKRINPTKWIPLKPIRISTILMTVLLTFLLMPLVSLINLVSMLFSTNLVSQSSEQWASNPFLVNLFMIAIFPAIAEELTFRGIFYHAYREKGILIGAFASALVFGIIHMNFNQFCYAFVLGLIFCGLVEITGSIFTSMIAHFVVNGWSVLLMHLQEKISQVAGSQAAESSVEMTDNLLIAAIGVYGIISVVCTILAALVLWWMIKHCKREEHMRWCFRKHPLPAGMKKNFVTVSFAIAAVIGVIYMVIIEMR